jgi:pyruvate dehydrogenase (quinone)/pyruvate oxidase
VDIGLVGDAQATLRELLMYLPRNEDRSFLKQAQKDMGEWWDLMKERGTRTSKPMKPEVVAWNLGESLADDAIITGDSGTVTTWIARMKLRDQQQFSFSGTLCSMAAGLPYAIGAQVAYPGRQVVTFTGDGSLSMMMGDLATLAQYKLPVKIVVLKNNTLGLIKWEQMIYLGNPEYGVDLYPIDFVKVAEGCGLQGVRIENPKSCQSQLKEALAMDGPVVVECITDPNEPPMPPKATKSEMKHLAEALVRGERDRARISLTIGRQAMDEALFPASDYGVATRIAEKLTGGKKKGGDEK